MTEVNINGTNHQVQVKTDNPDLAYAIEKAQKLWDDTKPADGGAGSAIGFLVERRGKVTGWADFRESEQPDVNARTETADG